MPIRVILAEDSYLVREGVARLLETIDDIELVAGVEDYDGLLAAVDEHAPDVVLTDIRMPPTGTDEGIRAANELRARHPDLGVVVLSQYVEPGYALALLDHGSNGRAYLLKERVSDIDQLLHAIREVVARRVGHRPDGGRGTRRGALATRAVAARAPHAPRARGARRDGPGPEQRGVAAALGLSERAVEKHINSVFSKLGLAEEPDVHRRVKAVLLYLTDTAP